MMLDRWLDSPRSTRLTLEPELTVALEAAGLAIGRLDQSLSLHPLLPALLYRSRLDAVRRQASVDGEHIDPWHLAAILEGLRIDLDGTLRIADRCRILDGAKTALAYHQWLTEPDFDQEGEVQDAEAHLAKAGPSTLLAAAEGLWSWLHQGGTRPPIRAALTRLWKKRGLLHAPIPLTGTRALSDDAPDLYPEWVVFFLDALADEARRAHDDLRALDHGWREARGRVIAERSTSRAPSAIDFLAAAPLVSAGTLARGLGMSNRAATTQLDRFVGQGIAIEVTHRSARRLFGLAGMEPLRNATTAPRRPLPGRGRGRPPLEMDLIEDFDVIPEEPPPVSRMALPAIDYTALDAAIAQADAAIRRARGDLG